jgi:hypothetical protein
LTHIWLDHNEIGETVYPAKTTAIIIGKGNHTKSHEDLSNVSASTPPAPNLILLADKIRNVLEFNKNLSLLSLVHCGLNEIVGK